MSENLSRVENDLSELVDGTGEVTVPLSRVEVILHKLLGEECPNIVPQSRVEELLLELYDKEITGDIIPKEITEPGIYNATSEGKDGYNPVNVNIVIPPAPVLTTKNVTDNGTYQASSDNADGYSEVTVAIPLASGRSW